MDNKANITRIQATPTNLVKLEVQKEGLRMVRRSFDFAERFSALEIDFETQLKEEAELNQRILDNLAKVKVHG